MKRLLFLTFFFGFVFSGCVSLEKTPPKRVDKHGDLATFVALNDLNERAFAYHHYCLKEQEPLNERFLQNFKLGSDLLFNECVETLNWQPQYIVDHVVKRRNSIQQSLREYYQANGCSSGEAMAARDHYRAYSQLSAEEVKAQLGRKRY